MSNILFIDLETLPTESDTLKELVVSKLKAPANYKKQEAINNYIESHKDDAVLKTSFNGLYGSICCIGFALDDGKIHSVQRTGSEKQMLEIFFRTVNKLLGQKNYVTWSGHNIAGFDLPFLYQRCLVNGVKPTINLPIHPTAWHKDVFDTLYQATGKNVSGGSLDAISKILGIGSKTKGMDGSQVYQYWLDGRIDEIVSYCRDDVNLTRDIYKRLNFVETVEDIQRPEYTKSD